MGMTGVRICFWSFFTEIVRGIVGQARGGGRYADYQNSNYRRSLRRKNDRNGKDSEGVFQTGLYCFVCSGDGDRADEVLSDMEQEDIDRFTSGKEPPDEEPTDEPIEE